MLLQDQPQRPSTSPRSIASATSLLPGYPLTTFNLAPNAFFNIAAKISGSEPEPSAPTANGLLNMSSQFLTGDVCHSAQTLTSLVALPSHENLRESYCAAPPPINGSIASPRPNMPNTVPSLGATANR